MPCGGSYKTVTPFQGLRSSRISVSVRNRVGEYIAMSVCIGNVYHLSCCDSCWFTYFDTCQLRNKICRSGSSNRS